MKYGQPQTTVETWYLQLFMFSCWEVIAFGNSLLYVARISKNQDLIMPIEELKEKYLQKIPDLSWYLIRTMPKSEQNAEVFFKMNCIPCYLPRYNRVYINSFA